MFQSDQILPLTKIMFLIFRHGTTTVVVVSISIGRWNGQATEFANHFPRCALASDDEIYSAVVAMKTILRRPKRKLFTKNFYILGIPQLHQKICEHCCEPNMVLGFLKGVYLIVHHRVCRIVRGRPTRRRRRRTRPYQPWLQLSSFGSYKKLAMDM